MENTLAKLLYHFDWALPRGIGRDDVDMDEIFGLATRKNSPLVLVPTVHEGSASSFRRDDWKCNSITV